jgi:Alternative complex III, ActD subunit
MTPALAGLLAEFEDVDSVMHAARHLRDAGYSRWDVHSPCPIHGMDEAMGIRPTILPWLVLAAGVTGLVGGVLLQWYCNAFDYPFLVSGKPLVSLPAWIPVTFELTILCSALTAVFGMLLLNRLPHLYNPLFKSRRFRRVTSDRFFIVIDSDDPMFDREQTEQALRQFGATAFEWVED